MTTIDPDDPAAIACMMRDRYAGQALHDPGRGAPPWACGGPDEAPPPIPVTIELRCHKCALHLAASAATGHIPFVSVPFTDPPIILTAAQCVAVLAHFHDWPTP